jgi:two-component system NarL family sensor kinase
VNGRYPRTRVVVAVSILGLLGCVAWFAALPHGQIIAPLTALLAGTAALASLTLVDLDEALFLGGSLVANVCAIALLGPAPAALVALAGEVAVLVVDRYRLSAFPMNLLGGVLPNMAGAALIQTFVDAGSGLAYYLGVFAVAWVAVLLNGVLVTSLVVLERGDPLRPRLRSLRRLATPVGLNIVVAIGAVAVYRNDGLDGIVFVFVALLVFAYSSKQLALQQRQVSRISALADGRGRLVAQTLEAEDRERRLMADTLHDQVIQPLLVLRQDLVELDSDDRLLTSVDSAVEHLRRAIRATHPSILERIGLEPAIRAVAEYHAERAGVAVSVTVGCGVATPGPYERLLFSSTREFILNVVRHAEAENVTISIEQSRAHLSVSVVDDGLGWELPPVPTLLEHGHFGLAALIDRVEAVGGSVSVSRRVDSPGTLAVARVPTALPTRDKAGSAPASP